MSEGLLVKAKLTCFYADSRQKVGTQFYIAKLEDFSHAAMVALNFEPPPMTEAQARFIGSSEYKSKFKKFQPYDKKTHPKSPAAKAAEFKPAPGDEVQDDEPQATVPVKKAKATKGKKVKPVEPVESEGEAVSPESDDVL